MSGYKKLTVNKLYLNYQELKSSFEGAGQHVNFGSYHCWYIGKIVHELMHALGYVS